LGESKNRGKCATGARERKQKNAKGERGGGLRLELLSGKGEKQGCCMEERGKKKELLPHLEGAN